MNRRSQGYEPCEIPLLYPALNPDSRVSKAFNVSCLPRVVSNALSFQKKNVNKNFIQGGEPSCVPDGKYTWQGSNLLKHSLKACLLNFPLKRVYQLL